NFYCACERRSMLPPPLPVNLALTIIIVQIQLVKYNFASVTCPNGAENPSVRQPRLVQQRPSGPVLDLDDPQVRIEPPLPVQRRVDLRLRPVGEWRPDPRPCRVIAARKGRRRAIEPVCLHHHCSRRGIAAGSHEGRDIGQPQPRQIGLNPEFRRQPRGHFPPSRMSSPIASNRSASSSQPGRTLTVRNRCTSRPRNCLISSRAALPTLLIVSPLGPSVIPL